MFKVLLQCWRCHKIELRRVILQVNKFHNGHCEWLRQCGIYVLENNVVRLYKYLCGASSAVLLVMGETNIVVILRGRETHISWHEVWQEALRSIFILIKKQVYPDMSSLWKIFQDFIFLKNYILHIISAC